MWDRLVHPRMLATDFSDLSDFFSSLCTIQEGASADNAYGEEVLTWRDKAGHIDLPCTIAPVELQIRDKGEKKKEYGTYVVASHHVTIAGDYPLIQEKMRAVVNGTAYDILLVEWDSQSETTRLACRLVT